MIPYRVNRFTNSVSACKLNEYLFFGLLVVSTPFAEASRLDVAHPGLITLAGNSACFSDAIRLALSEVGDISLSQARNSYAVSTGWSSKYTKINKLINAHLDKSLQAPSFSTFSQSLDFIPRLKRLQRSVIVAALTCFSVYWLIFVSPLIFVLAYALAPRDPLGQPDTLLVLTGDGAGRYYNDSFMNRAQDVLEVHRQKPNIKVVISTARHRMISEVSVLKRILVDRGIPAANISVLTPTARNTWQHIDAIHATLLANHSGSLALLSSLMHARRAAAMLRKLVPRATFVSAPAVFDTPQSPWRWKPSLTYIRITTYELSAYAYAKLRGWV